MMTQELERARAAWNAIAPGFDEFVTPSSMGLAEDVLRRVDLHSGIRFLDVAAGSGAMSIAAARLGAQVVAADIASTMIARLNGRAQDEGLSNLEGRVMDGYALALDDDTFDISGSLNGVTVFPDLPRGLREMVRVTKPGGRVLLVAFGPPAKAEFLGFFIGAMRAAVPGFTGLPMNPPPLPFQVADSAVLRQKMAGAGLTDINLETVTWNMDIQSAMHLWNVVTNSNPIGATLVANLTTAQKSEILQALDRMLHERSGGSGPAVLSTTVNVGRGTK